MNPYQATKVETRSPVASGPTQRLIFATFVLLGLLSWTALHAVRDILIIPPAEPAQQRFLHAGLIVCMALGLMCVSAGCFGIYRAIRHRVFPLLLTMLYLFTGIGLCYAAGAAMVGYVMIYGE